MKKSEVDYYFGYTQILNFWNIFITQDFADTKTQLLVPTEVYKQPKKNTTQAYSEDCKKLLITQNTSFAN